MGINLTSTEPSVYSCSQKVCDGVASRFGSCRRDLVSSCRLTFLERGAEILTMALSAPLSPSVMDRKTVSSYAKLWH